MRRLPPVVPSADGERGHRPGRPERDPTPALAHEPRSGRSLLSPSPLVDAGSHAGIAWRASRGSGCDAPPGSGDRGRSTGASSPRRGAGRRPAGGLGVASSRLGRPDGADHRVLERPERGERPVRHRRRPGREPVVRRRGHDPGHRADHPGRGDHRVLQRPEPGERPGRHRRRPGREPVVHRPGHDPGHRADHARPARSPSSRRPERRERPGPSPPARTGTCGSPTRARPGPSGGSPRPGRSPSSRAG